MFASFRVGGNQDASWLTLVRIAESLALTRKTNRFIAARSLQGSRMLSIKDVFGRNWPKVKSKEELLENQADTSGSQNANGQINAAEWPQNTGPYLPIHSTIDCIQKT